MPDPSSSAPCWTIAGGRRLVPAPFLIMGIVNITPDSFYDQGRYFPWETALKHAENLAAQGADILDLGAESTRPFAAPISPEIELERLMPLLEELLKNRIKQKPSLKIVPAISIDTRQAAVAAAALAKGAEIINDVSACSYDPALKDLLAHYQPGYVLMHSKGYSKNMRMKPAYKDILSDVLAFFENKLAEIVKAGLMEENIVLDPGIGFDKTLGHNLKLLKSLEAIKSFGRPIMLGLSNKSMWGELLGLAPDQRNQATQIGLALTAISGAAVHRVHEVAATVRTREIVRVLSCPN